MKDGFRAAARQPFLLIILFVYRFIWGFALYRICQSIILPLLHRFPGQDVSPTQLHLFIAEGQFELLKTDLSHPTLWLLLSLLVVRAVLTPFLNAGTIYSLTHTEYHAGYRFVRGIRVMWRSYLLYYVVQTLLTLLPIYWIWPRASSLFLTSGSYEAILKGLAPYLIGMLLYGFLLQLLFLHIQLGRAQDMPLSRTFLLVIRSLPLILGIAAGVLVLSTFCSILALGATLCVAGFWMLVLYQGYRLIGAWFTLWGLAAQTRLQHAKLLR